MKVRLRRIRQNNFLRSMTKETCIHKDSLIAPLFIKEGYAIKEEISSMPGQYRFSLDNLAQEVKDIAKLGIRAVLLFGLPKYKNKNGREAYSKNGIIQRAIDVVKKSAPEMVVVTDVCLCEYTSNGHCGIYQKGRVDNDKTLDMLARTAVSHAESGSDVVAPSAMMDGQVKSIRLALDKKGFDEVPILSYSAKYASGFYGPFREAAACMPQIGDRKGYQMDTANIREALREIELDIEEGADMVMIKPALAYLDVIHAARRRFSVPLVAYNVSGEYAMIKAASQNGWLDETQIIFETLTAIKRAGADIIITYFAKDVASQI